MSIIYKNISADCTIQSIAVMQNKARFRNQDGCDLFGPQLAALHVKRILKSGELYEEDDLQAAWWCM